MASVFIDGRYPAIEILARRATVNYGHFTSMQVRNRAVKGFDLHLARLRAASMELSDAELDPQRVHTYLRAALPGTEDVSVRIDIFPSITADAAEHIMVTISGPEPAPAASVTLQSVAYQRPVPHLKHAGGFAQLFHQKRARKAGFSDALLVGNSGELSETAAANIGFIRDGEIIWPSADALHGITWQLLSRIFAREGIVSSRQPIHLTEVSAFDAAFTANSQGITPVSRIDTAEIPVSNELLQKITALYEAEPPQLI